MYSAHNPQRIISIHFKYNYLNNHLNNYLNIINNNKHAYAGIH
jgi:hypothetical protein